MEIRLSKNVQILVEPLIKRLQKKSLNEAQGQLLREIEENLRHVTASFVTELNSEYIGLSPMEIQVAAYI